MSRASFLEVQTTPRKTSEGVVQLPITYSDNSNLVALFQAPAQVVAEKLRPEGLSPVLLGGAAQIGVVFFEYAASAIGPYNEVGVAALATRDPARTPALPMLDMLRNPRRRGTGVHVLHLPVTTQAACAAGRELWGYPKFVTSISIEERGRGFRGVVADPEHGMICELIGTRPLAFPIPAPGLLTYSRLQETHLDTAVDVRGVAWVSGPGTLRLRIGDSQHPMANTLRELGLADATPQLLLHVAHSASVLHAGTVAHAPHAAGAQAQPQHG